MSQYPCKFCDKSFTLNKNLLRHLNDKHKQNEAKYKCDICEYSTWRKYTLQTHKSIHRPNLQKVVSNNVLCAICNYTCSTHNIMLQHYKSKHDIISNKECLTFESEEKFYEWKLSVEKSEKNNFVRNRGKRTALDGKSKLTFICFRDGVFKSRASKGRREKSLGSNKINGHCPARIEVFSLPSGEVKVEFFKTHVGHQNELRRMRLSKNERDEIAENIALKIPYDDILDNLRVYISNDQVERRNLITRKDFHNIARDYNLKTESVRHINNDSTSVHSWVEQMQKTGKIVVFYKAQGSISQEFSQLKENDFVLIIMNDAQCKMLKRFGEKCVCIDSTHGLNSYGFELTTLLVLDDLNQGFPCTFMFSNRTDCEILEILLLNVRNVLGNKLKTNIFMSDMADEFFNAWLAVMEQPKVRLFCSWDVDRAWKQNLCKIKGNKEKQAEVYKVIRTLMEERDQLAFERMFKEVANSLKSNSSTAEFGEYFYGEYQHTVSNWAYCYRQTAGLNTNIHLERMHGVIKHIYLKGNKPKRIDIAVHILMRFLRDKIFGKINCSPKGKLTSKISAIRQRHVSSLQLDVDEVNQSNNDLWKLFSKDNSEIYEVTKVNDTCKCDLKCVECKICIHTYICTCPDSSLKFNMCKHIHFVQKLVNQELTEYNDGPEEIVSFINEPIESVSQETIVIDLQNDEIILNNNDLQRKKDLIMDQFLNVLNEVNSEDDLELINKMIRQSQAIMRARNSVQQNSVFSSVDSEEPPTKQAKFEPQRKYVSTKKPRKQTLPP